MHLKFCHCGSYVNSCRVPEHMQENAFFNMSDMARLRVQTLTVHCMVQVCTSAQYTWAVVCVRAYTWCVVGMYTNVLQLPLTTGTPNRNHWHHLPYIHHQTNLPLKIRGNKACNTFSRLLSKHKSEDIFLNQLLHIACIPGARWWWVSWRQIHRKEINVEFISCKLENSNFVKNELF